MEKICKQCGKEFSKPKNVRLFAFQKRKFCGYDCKNKYQIGRFQNSDLKREIVNVYCLNCNKEMECSENRLKKFCSRECYWEYPKSPELIEKWKRVMLERGNFKRGKEHRDYGKTLPEKQKKEISETLKQKYNSGEIIVWNKGLTKEIEPRINLGIQKRLKKVNYQEISKKSSETNKRLYREGKRVVWNKGMKGIHLNPKDEFKKGQKPWNVGVEMSDDSKKKMLETKKKNDTIYDGERHPMWLGGKSFEPYPVTFNKIFKNMVKMRDNFCCLKCGVSEQKYMIFVGRKLGVHHVDYNKDNTFLQNCCTLCTNCNSRVNKDRKNWTKFFQSLLTERYGYKYSENGEIILEVSSIDERRL